MKRIAIMIFICFLLLSCSGKPDYHALFDAAREQYAAADYEASMSSLIQAEDAADDDITVAQRSMLLLMKGAVYQAIFAYDEAIKEFEKVLALFDDEENEVFLRTVSYLCDIYIDTEDEKNARKYLEILEEHKSVLNIYDLHMYHMMKIKLAALQTGAKAAAMLADEYLDTMPNDGYVPWRIIAYYYNESGNHEKALECIGKEAEFNDVSADPHYHMVLSIIQSSAGDWKTAYSTLRRAGDIDDSLEMIRLKHDTRFLDERHANEVTQTRHRKQLMSTWILLVLLVISAASVIWTLFRRYMEQKSSAVRVEEEKQQIEHLYAEVLVEKEALNKMNQEEQSEELKKIIKQRLALLNKVITSYITDTSAANQEANGMLESLISDREVFMESTRQSFDAAHPRFMAYLRSCGLTDWEINYCCLYLVGLNGKEIGEYINLKRHYTYGSVIRHKLGLGEHDRNLANHLKNLLENPPA